MPRSFSNNSILSSLETSFHLTKASLAPLTAVSESSFDPREIIAKGSSLEGLITSKSFGLEGLTRAFALDGREHGVAVSIIHPGNVATNIWKGREEISEREGLIPLEDIGKLAVTMLTVAPNINILGSTILPITQPYLGRG